MARQTGGPGLVQVVLKAGAVLEHLEEHGELTAGALADALDEPRSSVYRLLATLQALDLVAAGSRRGTYRLGFGLLRLGRATVSDLDVRHAALPVMERIRQATGETVFLAVRRGGDAVCIERLGGERVQSLALRLGGSLPLHAGAVSRVLLAFGGPDLLDELLANGPLEAFTPHTLCDEASLREDVEATRQRGVVLSDQDVTLGIAAIGAPIFDYTDRIHAALSISGVRPAIVGPRLAELQRMAADAAAEVSRALGHRVLTGRSGALEAMGADGRFRRDGSAAT